MVIFFVCLVPVRLLLSSTAGFVPREWLAAKGLSQLHTSKTACSDVWFYGIMFPLLVALEQIIQK